MMLVKYKERELKGLVEFDVFRSVFRWIKDSRWRKKCKSLIKRARSQLLIRKNRKESIIRQSRDDIAQLLIHGLHDDALARVDQLHMDQCVLSAYDQIENFCDCVYTNLQGIDRRSKLGSEVNEAISSLVFAASRCGELQELHRMRMLFKKNFGDEFDRNNVELRSGNFVNSQIVYNLGKNKVTEDVKLQLTSKIAREYTLCLEPQANEPQCQLLEKVNEPTKKDASLRLRGGDKRDSNSKDQLQASIIKDMIWRIRSKSSMSISRDSVSFQCDCYNGSSEGSPPIQETDVIYLDDIEDRPSPNNGDSSGRHENNNLDSWDKSVSCKSFVKRSFAQRRDSLIKKDGNSEGSLHENKRYHRNMLSREGLSMPSSYSMERILTSSCHDKVTEENGDSKPRLSYVHPKLPDYDDLVATFTEYKKEYTKSNSNNRSFRKLIRW